MSIQIHSDYGDWAYSWGAAGNDICDFLHKISIDYVATKFGCGDYLDCETTVDVIKQDLDSLGTNWSEYESDINDLLSCTDKEDFGRVFYESGISDHLDLNLITKVKPHFETFWKEVWPVFIAAFKEDYHKLNAAGSDTGK